MEKTMISYGDLVRIGFPANQARKIIRCAKTKLVLQGYSFYNGRKVGLVPIQVVEEILGHIITTKMESDDIK